MRILVAADSFKDALPAQEVCAAIARGLHDRHTVVEHPLADGGEGTLAILARHLDLHLIDIATCDPLRRPIKTQWGLSRDNSTAYIELARASGLQLLAGSERSPLHTSTFGTGILIAAALQRNVDRVVLAIGGSATNDGGVGLLAALGWQFLSSHATPVEPSGGQLSNITQIVAPANWTSPSFDVLSDVDNPLFGPTGAAWMFARQKGANENEIAILDSGLRHFAHVTAETFGSSVSPDVPGAGAAGGVGFAASAFLTARLHRGSDFLIEATNFDAALANADLVITGEGHIDSQTLHGKLIHGVCRRAAHHGVPVIALCGKLTATPEQQRALGLLRAYEINAGATLDDALTRTAERLAACAARLPLGD